VTPKAADNSFRATFERLAPAAFDDLLPWQDEVLAALDEVRGDAAVELPTGAGKTVAALLVCEEYRERTGKPVAYLTGTRRTSVHSSTTRSPTAARLGGLGGAHGLAPKADRYRATKVREGVSCPRFGGHRVDLVW
jgi:hypothetical protein